MMDPEKSAGCMHIKLIEYHDCRTLMGPCFISFSLPLMIPGVVLTVVGSYGNERTFERFGGWHVLGIVILSFAVIMFVCGVILKCCYRPVLAADIQQHLTPESSMISGKHNLGYVNDHKIYSSKNAFKGNGKVGHHDTNNGNHVKVSTHESSKKATKTSNEKIQKRVHGEKQLGNFAQNKDSSTNESSNRRTKPEIVESDSVTHLPDIETFHDPAKKQRRKRTNSNGNDRTSINNSGSGDGSQTTEVEYDGVKTKVTAKVVVEAETKSGNRSRDQSSDTNENSTFLPPLSDEPPKRRKKKKRHRKSSSSGDPHDSTTDIKELPELRIKPTLGTNNHPHDQHVHFEAVPDQAGADSDSHKSEA